jgi:hypothetical protein
MTTSNAAPVKVHFALLQPFAGCDLSVTALPAQAVDRCMTVLLVVPPGGDGTVGTPSVRDGLSDGFGNPDWQWAAVQGTWQPRCTPFSHDYTPTVGVDVLPPIRVLPSGEWTTRVEFREWFRRTVGPDGAVAWARRAPPAGVAGSHTGFVAALDIDTAGRLHGVHFVPGGKAVMQRTIIAVEK